MKKLLGNGHNVLKPSVVAINNSRRWAIVGFLSTSLMVGIVSILGIVTPQALTSGTSLTSAQIWQYTLTGGAILALFGIFWVRIRPTSQLMFEILGSFICAGNLIVYSLSLLLLDNPPWMTVVLAGIPSIFVFFNVAVSFSTLRAIIRESRKEPDDESS